MNNQEQMTNPKKTNRQMRKHLNNPKNTNQKTNQNKSDRHRTR